MKLVTVKEGHYPEYATLMTLRSKAPFIPNTPGMITEEFTYASGLTICFVSCMPFGLYPNDPSTAINKEHLQSYQA